MKKIVIFVLTIFFPVFMYAQYSEGEIRWYSKNFNSYSNYYAFPLAQLDSITCSEVDYDVDCGYYTPQPVSYNVVNYKVFAYTGEDIKTVKLGIASASLADAEILSKALAGEITLVDTTVYTFTLPEGSYKVIALGYDENNVYRGYGISDPVTYSLTEKIQELPDQMCKGYLVYDYQAHETDMAWPSYMIAQTQMLGDMYPGGSSSGYDWYSNYNVFSLFGPYSYFSYLPWMTFYKFIDSANELIKYVDGADAPAAAEASGVAHTCRAFDYYTLMTFYEPKANIYTDCSSVLGLTVPIVTEKTTDEEAKNNPRATHKAMMDFILSDLAQAEKSFKIQDASSNSFPGLACAYGIKARAFMWDEQYDSAAVYARKAIDTWGEGKPATSIKWLDTQTGFNTANQAWMWKLTYNPETMNNLANFTGWMSAEANWGYGSLTFPCIDKSLYDKIATTDIRKYTFLDPNRNLYSYQTVREDGFLNNAPDYMSLKFRCKDGNTEDYKVGGATDVPVMRIEEFYFIEAEATAMAQNNLQAGISLLESFMTKYRDESYKCTATTLREFQKEVLTQERIEFWGEGEAFAQAKRIQPGVIQNYDGTNAPESLYQINCYGMKPNWNFVIPQRAITNNSALEGYNNPDPSGTVSGPTTIGTYATGQYTADKHADEK